MLKLRWPTVPRLPWAALRSSLTPFVAGLLLVSAGAYLVYPPAGLIVPGIVLLYVALCGDKPA